MFVKVNKTFARKLFPQTLSQLKSQKKCEFSVSMAFTYSDFCSKPMLTSNTRKQKMSYEISYLNVERKSQ